MIYRASKNHNLVKHQGSISIFKSFYFVKKINIFLNMEKTFLIGLMLFAFVAEWHKVFIIYYEHAV